MTKLMADSLAGVDEKENGRNSSIKNSQDEKDIAKEADRLHQV